MARLRRFNRLADGAGIECKFYRRRGKGFKLFFTQANRDHAYDLQRRAAEVGLGPPVGERFEAESATCSCTVGGRWHTPKARGSLCSTRHIYYGYETELVKVAKLDRRKGYADPVATEGEVAQLSNALKCHGLPAGDLHKYNVGRDAQGNVVRIDFGQASTTGGSE